MNAVKFSAKLRNFIISFSWKNFAMKDYTPEAVDEDPLEKGRTASKEG